MHSVKKVKYVFQITRPLSTEEAREIAVDCVEKLLDAINSSQKLRPDLCEYPFRSRHITIGLLISQRDQSDLYDPYPAAVTVLDDFVWFDYKTPDQLIGYSHSKKEPYEEALRIVRDEK